MEHIKLLKRLGLTEYESRAYLSLAKLGPSTVKEIVLDSKLPRNKAYEVLQRLEEKNKVLSLPVSPRKYKINNPELFKEEVNDLSKSVHSLIKLIEQPKITEFKDLFWVIKSKKAIEEKLAIQNTKAKKEILGCNKLSKILYKNIRTMKEAVNRRVKVKMICTLDKNKISSYKAWLKTGAKIRVFNEKLFGPLLPRITVFDGEIARLTIGKPEVKNEEEYITLWTESKAFSQMLKNHFINMWNNSEPIEKYII
jgi:sugar-specific transcriptional regulator TrmB